MLAKHPDICSVVNFTCSYPFSRPHSLLECYCHLSFLSAGVLLPPKFLSLCWSVTATQVSFSLLERYCHPSFFLSAGVLLPPKFLSLCWSVTATQVSFSLLECYCHPSFFLSAGALLPPKFLSLCWNVTATQVSFSLLDWWAGAHKFCGLI